MTYFASYRQGISDKAYLSQLTNHFKKVDYYNLLEIDLLNTLTAELPFTLVEKMEKFHLTVYCESTDYNSLTNTHNALLYVIGYYSERGYYQLADQLIEKINNGRSYNTFHTSYDMAMLEREEAIHLLRQDKREGMVKARWVIEFFRLVKAFEPTNEYYIEVLPQFIATVHQLNKTGELLFPLEESYLDDI